MANVEVSIDNDDVYNRFSPGRKAIITMVLVWSSFQCTLATTTVISAIPEVGATFHTTETTIAISNAVMLLCQVAGPILYAPIANTIGRRPILLATNAIVLAFSLGTGFAPNLPSYFIFRFLTAPQVTASQVIATVVIGDIYPAVTRGRALGWLMVSTTLGPGIAPLLGGAIVSYTSWRVIFWTQTGMASLSVLLLAIFLPETIHEKKTGIFDDLPLSGKVKQFLQLINPSEIITLLISAPGLAINAITVITLHWNMYSTLTPIREVLNPRFHLSSPLQAGLFYLAPSAGFLTGLFCGGQLSDWVVRRYIRRRGRRVPEDRLNSTVGVVGIALPVCSLLYGWAVQQEVGGIPLVVVALFLQGVFQVVPFISLNVYCVDVMEGTGKSSLAVAGSYMVRNVAAAAGTAACLPAIEAIGVGWFMTIAAGLLVVAAGFLWLATQHGEEWRMRGEEKSTECSPLPWEK
ncbi:major facilitator superfamily domain-containing protein [Penicillium cosmopolitanum]|uniref:Major facilitator superfamily domain-containing protein n=1 Tax=Penicillium cosmopolitanum TaxID=1131564 RepID=A0A9X0B903_9EURO|nr:major facilitator superfamily domain-containing protein [Penicillium cosmopolitanum]KAJ5392526.1 major facilitator superfamily domain-containing protein [Penicillium cosmopolitanum]